MTKTTTRLFTTFSVLCSVAALVLLAGCERPADVASRNLSAAADNFEVTRRVVFFNGITDSYLLTIEGRCSLGSASSTRSLTVTCKDGPNSYKKHFLGLSDNVSFFVEQMEAVPVSVYHYRVAFRPRQIIPNIDLDVTGKQ
jgi:hypothetical protein